MYFPANKTLKSSQTIYFYYQQKVAMCPFFISAFEALFWIK